VRLHEPLSTSSTLGRRKNAIRIYGLFKLGLEPTTGGRGSSLGITEGVPRERCDSRSI
jgi:hypothetical protein